MNTRLRTLPPWVWLTAIVVASALLRIVLARRMVAPWIMVDELTYSELAKSFAHQGAFLIAYFLEFFNTNGISGVCSPAPGEVVGGTCILLRAHGGCAVRQPCCH